jgi:cytochrome c nitrite reductase small subunit
MNAVGRRLRWTACAALGVVLGLGAYTFRYAEGTAYLSNDPRACVNCHIMRDHYDGWQKASHHAAAACNDCHVPHDLAGKYLTKAENGFWHSYGFTFQNFAEPIRIKPRNARVLQDNCIECHSGLVREIIDRGSAADSSNNCLRCHAAVGHGPER